jgi:hypothetical protein
VKRKIEDRVKFVIFQLIEGHNSGTTKGILTKFYLDLYVAVKTLCNNCKTFGHRKLKLEHRKHIYNVSIKGHNPGTIKLIPVMDKNEKKTTFSLFVDKVPGNRQFQRQRNANKLITHIL